MNFDGVCVAIDRVVAGVVQRNGTDGSVRPTIRTVIRNRSMSPRNLEILAYEDTPLGPLCLRRRELLAEPGTVVTEVTLNHEFLK